MLDYELIRVFRPIIVEALNTFDSSLECDVIDTYQDFENIKASVQSVSIDSMKKLELDFAKTYKMIYSLTNLNTISKNSASDLIVYNSENYQVVKKDSDWISYNGWNGVLVVRL